MEETVVNESPVPATVFAFAPEDSSPVDEGNADPAGEEVQETGEQTVEAEESAQGVDDQQTDQDKVSRAIGKEKHRIREQARQEYERKLQEDPVRQLGQLMVDDLMTNQGLSEEEAIKKATDNFITVIAKRDGVSVGMARKLYGKEIRKEIKQASTEETDIQRIVNELKATPKPEGFDEAEAYQDDAFVTLLREMPVDAAIRVYMAERKASQAGQDIAEKLKARQAIPQSTRPQQPVTPKTDWTKASSEDFFAEKRRRQNLR